MSTSLPPDYGRLSTQELSEAVAYSSWTDPSPCPRSALKRMASEDPAVDGQAPPAKAPRLADDGDHANRSASPEPSLEVMLARELACAVCTEIFHHPITILPCLHNFCGSCASRWLDTNPTCPTCRTKATSTGANPHLKELVANFLRKHPERQVRGELEIQEMDSYYRPGQKIEICEPTEESEDDRSDAQSDFDVDDHRDYHYVSERELYITPCPCCDPNNTLGYVCPRPIRPNEMLVLIGQRRFSIPTEESYGHVFCSACRGTMPADWDRNNCKPCVICYQTCCGAFFECKARPNGGREWIQPIQNQTWCENSTGPLEGHNKTLVNSTEQRHLQQYMYTKSWSWSTVADFVRDYVYPTFPTQTRVCKTCARDLFDRNLMRWWIKYREDNNIPDPQLRPKCWYGFECRTQFRSSSHAERYDHACNPTPPSERVDNTVENSANRANNGTNAPSNPTTRVPIPSLMQPRRASNAALSNPSLHNPGSSTFPSSGFSNRNAYTDTDSSSGRRPFDPANPHPIVGARNTNEGSISGTRTEPPPLRTRQRQPAPYDPIAQARIDAQLGATGILQTRNLNPSNSAANEWWGSQQQEPMRGDVHHSTFRAAIEQPRTWEYQRHQYPRNWMPEVLRQDQQRENHGGPNVPDNVELGED